MEIKPQVPMSRSRKYQRRSHTHFMHSEALELWAKGMCVFSCVTSTQETVVVGLLNTWHFPVL